MSGGQDEASEYIKTGGVNVFKKTERIACRNCVFWQGEPHHSAAYCNRFPDSSSPKVSGFWCGEFVDREPEAKPFVDVVVEQAIENVERGMAERDKPAGELREWWVKETIYTNAWGVRNCIALVDPGQRDSSPHVHAREVPSPERVREALDAFATSRFGHPVSWDQFKKGPYVSVLPEQILTILRSLGVPTEGV